MFSFAGDTVLDPFLGTGSTSVAAVRTGRNSIGSEIEPVYIRQAYDKLQFESRQRRFAGATRGKVWRTGF
jgi:site-specific DNA-methyltransferase (adenine-specific)